MRRLALLTLLAAASSAVAAQPVAWESSGLGQTAIVSMKSAPYPHASRAEGFKSGDKTFPRDPHYVDNSVALFIPKGYRPQKRTDLLIYFHGHSNNIRKAITDFRLREQVVASGRNVILVFPEGPKDVPDSGGGRLEEKGGLRRLVEEVLDTLASDKKIPGRELGRIALAGHSGAYRVISFCVEQGGLPDAVCEVGLLDASYDRLDAFVDWTAKKADARLFSIFTDHLAGENVYLMTHLRKRDVAYELFDEEDVTEAILSKTRIAFVNTRTLKHNDTVQWLEQWLRAGRSATQTGTITKSQALELAKKEFEKQGLKVEDYSVSDAKDDNGADRTKWVVFFNHKKPSAPGTDHLVFVEKAGGQAVFMRGE